VEVQLLDAYGYPTDVDPGKAHWLQCSLKLKSVEPASRVAARQQGSTRLQSTVTSETPPVSKQLQQQQQLAAAVAAAAAPLCCCYC
jgi:hypothetical protein